MSNILFLSLRNIVCKRVLIKNCCNYRTYFDSCNQFNQNCFVVKRVINHKFVGLIIDDKLSWFYYNCLKGKLRSALRTLYKLRNLSSEPMLRMIYFGLVHSRIE